MAKQQPELSSERTERTGSRRLADGAGVRASPRDAAARRGGAWRANLGASAGCASRDVADANPARARAARPRGPARDNPTGGFTVREFTLAEVHDTIELRGVLEGTAARLAAERLTASSELDVARRLLVQMDELERLTVDSFADYMDATRPFIPPARPRQERNAAAHVGVTNSLPFASPSAMVFPTSVLPNVGRNAGDRSGTSPRDPRRDRRSRARAESVAREHALVARRVLDVASAESTRLSRIPGGPLIHVSVS